MQKSVSYTRSARALILLACAFFGASLSGSAAAAVTLKDLNYCGSVAFSFEPDENGRLIAKKMRMAPKSVTFVSATMEGNLACGNGPRDLHVLGSSLKEMVRPIKYECDSFQEVDVPQELAEAITASIGTEGSRSFTTEQLNNFVNSNQKVPELLARIVLTNPKMMPVPMKVEKIAPLKFNAKQALNIPPQGYTNDVPFCVEADGTEIKLTIRQIFDAIKAFNEDCETCPKGHGDRP